MEGRERRKRELERGRKGENEKRGEEGEGDRNQRVLGTSVNHRGQKCNSDCCLMSVSRQR